MKTSDPILKTTQKKTLTPFSKNSIGVMVSVGAYLALSLIVNPLLPIISTLSENAVAAQVGQDFTRPASQLFTDNKVLVKFRANTSVSDREAIITKITTKTRKITVTKDTGKVIQDLREMSGQETKTIMVAPKVTEQKALFSLINATGDKSRAGKVTASQPTWVEVKLDLNTNIPELVAEFKNNPKVETAQPNYSYALYKTPTNNTLDTSQNTNVNQGNGNNTRASDTANVLPFVTFTSPPEYASYPLGTPVPVSIHITDDADLTGCADQSCTLSGLTGYDGTWSTIITNPRDLTFSPSSPWTPPATGIYTLTATARDAEGLIDRTSRSVIVTGPPVVTFISPAAGASYTLGTPVPVSIHITDDENLNECMSGSCTIDGLTGYSGVWATHVTNPQDLTFRPYTSWTPPATGIYTLTATARDASGLTATTTLTFTVAGPSPFVTFTSPPEYASYPLGTPVPVSIHITDDADLTGCADQSCTLSGLTGYDGTWSTIITNPRDLTFSPSSPWTPPATGIYTLTATARDADDLNSTTTRTIAIFTAANYPNDYYFNTDLQTPPIYSWEQNYPDLWGMKTINAKPAWDKLYNFMRGDVNADGVINQADVSYLNSYIYNNGPAPQPFLSGDVDGNMKINIADSVVLGLFVQNNTPFPTPQPLSEITIAVVDTGLDMTHEDIQGNLWTNTGEIPNNNIDDDNNGYADDIHGWSFGNKNNPNIGDTVGHGTHVAGTIAGTTNNTAGIAGVCPSCKIMPLEANPLNSDNLAGGLLYAVNNGAKVISNSWGSVINDDLVNDALDIVNAAGVTLVFAAGNSSVDAMLFYPQKPYLITVAASDALDNPANFTNTGPRIDVAAPGVDILSLHATGTDLYGDGAHTLSSKYYRASGTSMAAPHVAGLAGLILTEHPGYSPAMIRNVLRVSAHDIGVTGWDQSSGYGRIDASAALDVDLPVPCVASISYPINWLNPKDLTNKVIDITGTATCAGSAMQKYVIDFKQGETGAWQQLATNTNTVENGVLFSDWNTSIFPQGKVTLRLSMTDTRGRIFQDMKEIKIGPSIKITMPPNPIDFQNPFMAPTLADISSSTPGQEIQFAEHAFTGTGQKVPGAWPKSPADSYLTGAMSRNGTIITQRFDNVPPETTIEFLRANGDSIFSFNKSELPNYNLFRTLTSVDFNPAQKDGDEIAIMTNNNLYILNASGQQISAIPLADEHANYGFGNIDGGNDIEIYTYYKNYFWQSKINVYKYTGQKILEINPTLYQTINPPYMINDSADMYSAADLNHDGKDEIIAVIYQSGKYAKVVAYTYTGAILWEKQIIRGSTMLDVSPVYQPTIADINSDGKIEIVIPSNDYLYLLDENGNELWSKHGIGYAYLDNQPLIANLDADPNMEILFTSSFGFMYALNMDGSVVNGYPVKVPGNLTYATPAVGDMDGDGLNEIVISDSMVSMDLKLTIFDTDAQANNLWPQFQQNTQRTGTYALTHCDSGIAGDANGDGSVDISDAVYLISYIFSGGPAPQPIAAGDVNGDGSVDISDAVYLISYIFSGGPAPKCSSNLAVVKLAANPKQNYTLQSFTEKFLRTTIKPATPL